MSRCPFAPNPLQRQTDIADTARVQNVSTSCPAFFTAPLPHCPLPHCPLQFSENRFRDVQNCVPASLARKKLAAERQSRAWQMYCSGMICLDIGKELGISESMAARMIKKAAKEHPGSTMTAEERSAVAMTMLMNAHHDIRLELQQARTEGRREDLRGLLSTQSLSASRCARVLEAVPEVQVNAAPVFNFSAFAQLTGGGEQKQLPEVEPVTVEVEKA